jgi:hypothetical protein
VGELWERERRDAFAHADVNDADDWHGFWRFGGDAVHGGALG